MPFESAPGLHPHDRDVYFCCGPKRSGYRLEREVAGSNPATARASRV